MQNKMKNLITRFIMIFGVALMPYTICAQANQQTADEIINIVKAQWAAEMTDPGNIAEQFKNIADDYTEFNADYSTRLDGKSMAMRLSEPGGKDPNRVAAAEMLNSKVQVYGDTAILTYNFAGVSKNKDGETKTNRAKSTRVYVKQGGKWKLVHANFAPDPQPKN